jgi:hypothetical protein
MYTLQEFLSYTKAFEYVIAIAFIAAFILFWALLTDHLPLSASVRGKARTSTTHSNKDDVDIR